MKSILTLEPKDQDPPLPTVQKTHRQNDISSIVSSIRGNIRAAQIFALSLLDHRPIRGYLRLAKITHERFKQRKQDRDVTTVTTSTNKLQQEAELGGLGIASSDVSS